METPGNVGTEFQIAIDNAIIGKTNVHGLIGPELFQEIIHVVRSLNRIIKAWF